MWHSSRRVLLTGTLAPLALWLDSNHATGTRARGVEPPPSMLWGSNPDAHNGAPPFGGGASTCSAKHRCGPRLLVEGVGCAGVRLATKTVRVVPWRTVGVGVAHGRYVLIRQARLIDAVMALQGRFSHSTASPALSTRVGQGCVPQAGLEPARPFGHVSLNHARMPAFATEGYRPGDVLASILFDAHASRARGWSGGGRI